MDLALILGFGGTAAVWVPIFAAVAFRNQKRKVAALRRSANDDAVRRFDQVAKWKAEGLAQGLTSVHGPPGVTDEEVARRGDAPTAYLFRVGCNWEKPDGTGERRAEAGEVVTDLPPGFAAKFAVRPTLLCEGEGDDLEFPELCDCRWCHYAALDEADLEWLEDQGWKPPEIPGITVKPKRPQAEEPAEQPPPSFGLCHIPASPPPPPPPKLPSCGPLLYEFCPRCEVETEGYHSDHRNGYTKLQPCGCLLPISSPAWDPSYNERDAVLPPPEVRAAFALMGAQAVRESQGRGLQAAERTRRAIASAIPADAVTRQALEQTLARIYPPGTAPSVSAPLTPKQLEELIAMTRDELAKGRPKPRRPEAVPIDCTPFGADRPHILWAYDDIGR